MAAISQNPILRKDVYRGVTGSGMQQVAKPSNDLLFEVEVAADTYPGLFRTDGSDVTKVNSFTAVPIDNWGVVGSATPNGWNGPDIPLTYDANSNTWSVVVTLTDGEIKFRNNNDWSANYGDNGADGTLEANGSNIIVAAGNYLITLDFTALSYSLKTPFISIPDPNFEQALIDLGFDKDGVINASISTSDAEAITQLDVTGKNIGSLQGIEAFINLSRLFCQNNQIQVLNISKNTALTVLECGGNQLTTLNVSKNLLLRTLGFGYNNISAIDVSKNLKLEVFWCNNNNITSQNLDLNTALAVVGLSNNPLTFVSLKNGNNVKIVYFEAFNTPKLACINADAVVSVSMTNSGKTFNENCAKSYYVNDNSQTGDVFTSAIGNNTNPGTKAEPFATITYALSQANERDTIYVDAGSYTEQVTIEKGISLIGAGANLTSILVPTSTVNPPGFGEQGVIQTAQNISDVHISNMTVVGRFNPGPGITPLILQTGGSVKNCRLLNGNQGIFYRVASALKTALVENNEIDAEYIAVNFEGVNLTATLNNNTLSTNNTGFSAGMFAFVNQVTATNNLFSKYVSSGMQISATNASITQNAFTGAGTLAINRTGGATVTANCNWYGTTNATSVVTKVNEGVIYFPWLLDGTDASTQSGFQHNETCGASANIYYVNDNSTAEDIFTTTVGNDANTGTSPSSPLATINAALTKALPGATIYVDAGAYLPGDFTINKAVKIYGANYHISPNHVSDALLPNSQRNLNKETFITGSTISIGSNDISLEGIYFDPGAKSQIVLTNTGYNNFSYKKNYSRITSGTFISLTGPVIPNTQTPAFGNHIIEDNRFEKTGTVSGIGITAGYLNDVTVNSNTFVTPSTATQRTLLNSYAGFGGVVTNFKYSNNVSLASNYDVFSFYLTSGIIENNIGMHGQRPLVIQTVAAGSSNVRISNNYFESDFAVNPPISYGCFDTGTPGSSSIAIIELNTVIQNPAGRNNIPIACRVQIAGTVSNPTATIRNNKFTFNGDYGSFTTSAITGLSLFGKLQTVFVENNELTFNGTNLTNTIPLNTPASSGIYLASDGGIANAIPSNAVMNFTGNKISGFGNSIAVYDASATAPNTFVGYGNLPLGVTVNIQNNSLTGDEFSINNGSTGQTVNATCNWYGSSDAAVVVPKISGVATYSPWLTNGTDADVVTTGFQPIANICNGRQNKFYVNDADITGDVFTTEVGNDANSGIPSAPLATIAAALTRASAGDTIYVDAGTYIGNVVINKSVALLGAKYGQHPGSSLDRGDETIIIPSATNLNLTGGSVIRITASGVTVDGLLIDGNNINLTSGTVVNGVDVNAATGIFNDDNIVSNLTVKNNIVKNTATYGIALFRTFANTTGPAVSGNLFSQNRVDNIGGRGIVFAYSAYGSIINNYITRCGNSGTWFSQINVANVNNSPGIVSGNYIEAGNVGMQSSSLGLNASAVYYQNNHIVGKNPSSLGLSLLIANQSGIVVSNNKFADLNTGIAANNTGNQNNMMTVTITNNSFENISNLIFNIFSNTYFDARCNWYGSTAAQDFINKLPLASNLDIVPWLTNGTDNDAATGFQPVPNSCEGYPTLITLNGSTNVTCNGAANGSINITASFGKAPIVFTWTKEEDAGFISHDEDPTGLTPGTYHLAILDANGSNIYITDPEADGPGTITVTITEPDVLTAAATGSNNVCFNGSIGTASVTPVGGTAPYTYLWGTGASTDEISNLATGIYTVTVTDANGCKTTASYEVTQPTQVTASITNVSTACSNIATVTAGGGTPGYTYLWSNGSQAATISGVPVGTYTVTVTDANGCTTTATVNLTVSEAFNPSASVTNVSCFGGNNGIITVTNANGTAPFMFSKDGGVTFVSGTLPYSFTNLLPGTYTIAVKDANGCVGFIDRTVAQPTQLVASLNTVQSACFNQSNGAVSVTVTGGVTAYTYRWTGPNGYTSSQLNISGLAAGNYTLTVTDKNGCTYILPVEVQSISEIVVNESISNITCRGAANGSISATANGGTNSLLGFSYLWNTGSTATTISNLAPGNYNVRITDNGSGCFINKSYIITQPASALALTTTKTNATGCSSLGTITATGSGGTSPYNYSVNGIALSGNSIGSLYAGDYTVSVTDANGCTTSKLVTITDNGSDEYEGNNSKNQAKPMPAGGSLTARLAIANDAADWFRFTAPVSASGLYSVKMTHPNTVYTFNVYASGNNTPPIAPTSVINSGEKHYQLTAGTTYFVSITTATLSFVCYNLTVSALEPIEITANTPPSSITVEAAPTVDLLKAFTYPNPHNGNFTLSIESPEDAVATIEMFTVNGQKLSERKANVVKGKGNTVKYSNMNYAILFYKVRIGSRFVTGKITSPN